MMDVSDGRWHPGIGDPSVTGWVTVAAYATAVLVCYACYRQGVAMMERKFWCALGLVMTGLGVNKQLDLQSWFTEIGRDMALSYGWYNERRAVQILFISCLALFAMGVAVWLAQHLKQLSLHARLAGTGLLLLGFFVLLRATSIHHVDAMLKMSLLNLRMNVVLELSGIAIIVVAGVRHLYAGGCRWRWNSYKLLFATWAKQRERANHVNIH